jgi:hypothetical protein
LSIWNSLFLVMARLQVWWLAARLGSVSASILATWLYTLTLPTIENAFTFGKAEPKQLVFWLAAVMLLARQADRSSRRRLSRASAVESALMSAEAFERRSAGRARLPTISVITPSLNQAEFLEDCIESVLGQGYPHLEYIVMDGGSTDGSIDIIRKYARHLTYWQSQADGGHYAAVAEGFGRTTGDVMAWLNADDKFCPLAFFKAAYVFLQHPEISWITGRPVQWSVTGRIEHVCTEQIVFSRERVVLEKEFRSPWIQQESTFWRRQLWSEAGGGPRPDLELAGDLELWVRFFRRAQLQLVDTLLGGNRRHDKQRSVRFMDAYLREADTVLNAEANRPAPECSSAGLSPLALRSEPFRHFLLELNVPMSLIAADEMIGDLLADLVQLTDGHHQQLEANRRATAALLESEADRRSRLDVINDLSARLAESDFDRTARLEVIGRLETMLAESEADRAARLLAIRDLSKRLAEADADRVARAKTVEELLTRLAERGG